MVEPAHNIIAKIISRRQSILPRISYKKMVIEQYYRILKEANLECVE